MNKRYYWLKLMDDFFTSKRIKKLRNLAGGDTYTIIYLKMQLKALKTDGYLYFDGIMDDFAEELALDLDEKEDDVRITINYLLSVGLLEMGESEKEYKLTYMDKLIGSEGASAQKVRNFREREKEKRLQCNQDVTEMKPTCNGEIDIEKEKELELEIEIEKDKEKRENKKQSAERIVEMYHIQCPSLPKVMKLTESRIRAINARLKEFTEEDIETAFVKAENSPFLRGEKGDWKANFDWIMKPGNLPKILEGNYDEREQVKKDSFDSMLEDWAKGGSDGKERVFGFSKNDESSASGNVSGE